MGLAAAAVGPEIEGMIQHDHPAIAKMPWSREFQAAALGIWSEIGPKLYARNKAEIDAMARPGCGTCGGTGLVRPAPPAPPVWNAVVIASPDGSPLQYGDRFRVPSSTEVVWMRNAHLALAETDWARTIALVRPDGRFGLEVPRDAALVFVPERMVEAIGG